MGTLINGIKELYQSTLTTGSFFPVCDTNGSPTGHISAADLASVLGANISKYLNQESLANIREVGTYFVQNCSDGPLSLTGVWGVVVVSKTTNGSNVYRYVQTFSRMNGTVLEKYERADFGDGTWTAWYRLDNFGCSTAADLASLLGGLINRTSLSNVDLNDITEVGVYPVTSNITNNPLGTYWGFMIVTTPVVIGGKAYLLQFFTTNTVDGADVSLRLYWRKGEVNGSTKTWIAWQRFGVTN